MHTAEKGEVVVRRSVSWRGIAVALGLSLAGTVILGGLLSILQHDVWWVAIAGALSLFGGGAYLGRSNGVSEPLYGTLLAILYFGITVAIVFGGTLTDLLPDPLPGLEIGDSTFFFVWPLLMLACGVAGSIVGGLEGRRRQGKRRAKPEGDP